MSLGHAILSLLAHCPHSGYDLAKKFEGPVGCYWKASQQQVYRELAKLEEQGEVCYEAIPQEGRLDKKVYGLTDNGKQNLIDWVGQPAEPTAIREDLAIKLNAAHLVPRSVIIKEIERRRQVHIENRDRINTMCEIYAQEMELQNLPPDAKIFAHLKARRGIRYETDWIDWCNEALEVLQNS